MPDSIEEASTGRAKCRACREKIEKGSLRFGESVPNAFGEGDATHWFHLLCAAERRPEKLEAALKSHVGEVPDREQIERIAAEGAKNPKLAEVRRAERSPTGRAGCQHCHEKIPKDELRVAFEREAEGTQMATTSYVHAKCAAAHFGPEGLFEKLARTSSALGPDEVEALKSLLAG